eukprot:9948935-Karenia_brevis.AAC.1
MGNTTVGPYWNPDSGVPFRTWMRELGAWLNIHSGTMTPTAQAAAIQMGLGGLAREFAMNMPAPAITFGAQINGVHIDPVTHLVYSLASRFEVLEDERMRTSGNAILDFRARP